MGGAGHMASVGKSTEVLVGKPEGKRPLGRPRRRWKVTIIMYLQEAGYKLRLELSGS
jgi:hypothetical protein